MFYLAMRWKLVVVDSVFYFYNCNLEPGIKGLQKVAVGARLQRCLSNSCDCQVRLCNLCILAEQTRLAWRQEFRSVHYASSVWLVVAGLRRIRIFRNLSETTLHRATSQWFQHCRLSRKPDLAPIEPPRSTETLKRDAKTSPGSMPWSQM